MDRIDGIGLSGRGSAAGGSSEKRDPAIALDHRHLELAPEGVDVAFQDVNCDVPGLFDCRHPRLFDSEALGELVASCRPGRAVGRDAFEAPRRSARVAIAEPGPAANVDPSDNPPRRYAPAVRCCDRRGALGRLAVSSPSPVCAATNSSASAGTTSTRRKPPCQSTEAWLPSGYDVHETRGKTRNARRRIDLDSTTVAVLTAWRHWQQSEQQAVGIEPSHRMFTDGHGATIHPHAISQTFERIARRAGVRVIRLHDSPRSSPPAWPSSPCREHQRPGLGPPPPLLPSTTSTTTATVRDAG